MMPGVPYARPVPRVCIPSSTPLKTQKYPTGKKTKVTTHGWCHPASGVPRSPSWVTNRSIENVAAFAANIKQFLAAHPVSDMLPSHRRPVPPKAQ